MLGKLLFFSILVRSNEMYNISNLFWNITLHVSITPSIIRSLRLYKQHHTIQVLCLLASKQPQNLYGIYLMLYVQS